MSIDDGESAWVWIQCVRTPFQTFGPESEAFAEVVAEERERFDADILRRLPAGTSVRGDAFTGYTNGTTEMSGDYDALPRDPQQLLERIYEFNGDIGQSRDGQALAWIPPISALDLTWLLADVRFTKTRG